MYWLERLIATMASQSTLRMRWLEMNSPIDYKVRPFWHNVHMAKSMTSLWPLNSFTGTLATEFHANDLVQGENISCENRSDTRWGKVFLFLLTQQLSINKKWVRFALLQTEWIRFPPCQRGIRHDVQMVTNKCNGEHSTVCSHNDRRWRIGGEWSEANSHHQRKESNSTGRLETAGWLRWTRYTWHESSDDTHTHFILKTFNFFSAIDRRALSGRRNPWGGRRDGHQNSFPQFGVRTACVGRAKSHFIWFRMLRFILCSCIEATNKRDHKVRTWNWTLRMDGLR